MLATRQGGTMIVYPLGRFSSQEFTLALPQATASSSRDQFDALRNRLRHQPGLPFLDLLCPRLVADLARRCNHHWRNRISTPWITLSLFLSQVLADDQSCTEAV